MGAVLSHYIPTNLLQGERKHTPQGKNSWVSVNIVPYFCQWREEGVHTAGGNLRES